jgi:hypothetical protein
MELSADLSRLNLDLLKKHGELPDFRLGFFRGRGTLFIGPVVSKNVDSLDKSDLIDLPKAYSKSQSSVYKDTSGQFIFKAVGSDWSDISYTDIVKSKDKSIKEQYWLDITKKQIAALKPRCVVVMGKNAVEALKVPEFNRFINVDGQFYYAMPHPLYFVDKGTFDQEAVEFADRLSNWQLQARLSL